MMMMMIAAGVCMGLYTMKTGLLDSPDSEYCVFCACSRTDHAVVSLFDNHGIFMPATNSVRFQSQYVRYVTFTDR